MKNDSIILPIIEILFMMFIIVIVYFCINSFNINYDLVNNLSIDVDYNNNYLYVLNNDEVDFLDNNNIKILNYDNKDINYRLVMKLKKDNFDYNNINMKLDNNKFSLSSKFIGEDNDYLYFDLTHQNVSKYDNLEYVMWLSSDVDNPSDYVFSYNFYVEKI